MSVKHMNQDDLAERWNISPRTLERWRWVGQGPRYIKIGGREQGLRQQRSGRLALAGMAVIGKLRCGIIF